MKKFEKFSFVLLLTTLILNSSSAKSVNNRIVNGHDTDISETPYQAIVLRKEFPLCGGVIINELTVLSAGYCFEIDEIDPTEFQVRVGSSNRNEGGIIAEVREIITHPNMETDPLTYNIAILKLVSPLSFTESIAAVTLPAPDIVVLPNSLASVSGYGIYDVEEELYPAKLQSGIVTIVPQTICTEAYAQIFPVRIQHICSTGDVSPCTGDEGSPLVQDGTLIGVVSFGFDCENSNFPTIYSRISEFRDFIDENL